MALPALATYDDLKGRIGSCDDRTQAEALLAQASAIVRAAAGLLWVDEGGELSGVPEGIPGVVVEMVARVCDNPLGVESESQTQGVRSQSVSFSADAAQRLYLSTADRIVIGSTTKRAFTIDPTPVTSAIVPDLTGATINAPEDSDLLIP
jgi:hypothetical protein